MTLRDWFAGQALAGMVSHQVVGLRAGGIETECIAERAYRIADAMIEEGEE